MLSFISRVLHKYLSRCITLLEIHLEFIRLGYDKREEKRKQTTERLNQLSSNLEAFFEYQKAALDEDVNQHVNSLKEFLHRHSSMAEVCR